MLPSICIRELCVYRICTCTEYVLYTEYVDVSKVFKWLYFASFHEFLNDT